MAETTQADSDDWANKTVVITAGGSGIGYEYVRAFHSLGCHVHTCDVVNEAIEAVARDFPGVSAVKADVSVPGEVDQFIDGIIAQRGRLDILINNAGIAGPAAPVEEIETDDWNRTFAINVAGQFYCIRRAAPQMKSQGNGVIINMSSVAGKFGFPLRSPYSASKWAVIGLTKSMALELGPFGIRVNAILPGIVEGERIRQVFTARAAAKNISYDEMAREAVERVALKKTVDPTEIADLVVFLCSNKGRSMSGNSVEICGGTESIV